jgi:hypothetical protein
LEILGREDEINVVDKYIIGLFPVAGWLRPKETNKSVGSLVCDMANEMQQCFQNEDPAKGI